MSDKKEKLVKIADFLDRNEMPEEADLIDEIIREKSDMEVEIVVPEDDLELLKQIYESLGQSLNTSG